MIVDDCPPDSSDLSHDFLRDVYAQLPVLIIRMTPPGVVRDVNRAAVGLTGFTRQELIGMNWWGMMFPGKLFAQVPKFVKLGQPGAPLLRDFPMTLRTKNGQERTIAWTRFERTTPQDVREIVCIGMDLTDRLTQADREAAGLSVKAQDVGLTVGPPDAEDTNAVEGDFILPLAISPKMPTPVPGGEVGAKAIQEAESLLRIVEERGKVVRQAALNLGFGVLGEVPFSAVLANAESLTSLCKRPANPPASGPDTASK